MRSRTDLMHLMTFTLFCPTQHAYGAWRYPLNTPARYDWAKPAVWQHIAREVERGMFDGMFETLRRFAVGETAKGDMTVTEGVRQYGQSMMMRPVVGSGRQVADELIGIWEETGAAGFLLTPLYYPGAISDFVDEVVPLLQKAGVFRRAYSGTMLRDHLIQAEPGR